VTLRFFGNSVLISGRYKKPLTHSLTLQFETESETHQPLFFGCSGGDGRDVGAGSDPEPTHLSSVNVKSEHILTSLIHAFKLPENE